MNASLRDLATRAAAVPAPHLDAAAVVETAESRLRRRRLLAVASVTAAVIVIVGTALLVAPDTRDAAPPPAGPDHKNTAPDKNHGDDAIVDTRPAGRELTYAVGTTIHWGNRTIDVRNQTHGRWARENGLSYVDATDDGVVFITDATAPTTVSIVWFTDGSAPVRIGTTTGGIPRGYQIASSAAGSTLAWQTDENGGRVVVYDTAQMKEVARFAGGRPLAVYDDVVYWTPGVGCMARGWGFAECEATGPVMRFDTATGQQTRVPEADYLADRRARPGLLTDPSDHGRGGLFLPLHLVRRGGRLLAPGDSPRPGADFTPRTVTVALTGRPLRLHLPAGDRNREDLAVTQWLDPDRVVLVDTGAADGTDFLTCRLSTGHCQLTVRLPDANYTEPGPVGIHG